MQEENHSPLPFYELSPTDLAGLYSPPQATPSIGHIASAALSVSPLVPDRVLLQIGTQLSSAKRTLSSLSLTCKAAHVLLVPILYNSLTLNATNSGWITHGLLPVPVRWLEGDMPPEEDPLKDDPKALRVHHHRPHLPHKLSRLLGREEDTPLFANPDPFAGHLPDSNGHIPQDTRFSQAGFSCALENHGRQYTTTWLRHKLACLRFCARLEVQDLPDSDALHALNALFDALLPKGRRKRARSTKVVFPLLNSVTVSAQALAGLSQRPEGLPSLSPLGAVAHLCLTQPNSGRTLLQWWSLYERLDSK